MQDLKELFQEYKNQILEVMPYSSVEHVGGSAISGIDTKGDLDIQIRVDGGDFEKAVIGCDSLFTRRYETLWNKEFALFADPKQEIKIDLMLTVKNSPYDSFFRIRDAMIQDSTLRERYKNLKKQYPDFLSNEYRKAKDLFFRQVESELGLKIRPLSTVIDKA